MDLIVVGGGASGLVCALEGARLGLRVLLLEKTERCGNKLVLTGGKKCNFTHTDSPREMAKRFDCPRELILPVLRRFSYQTIIEFFAGLGIEHRVDEDGCVWPVVPGSKKAGDARLVRDRLVARALELGVKIKTRAKVKKIVPGWRVVLEDGTEFSADNVCVATGGASYPQTGSTGDGVLLVRALVIKTAPFFPALAALKVKEDIRALAGITQQRVVVGVDILDVAPRRGNFIFAHEYISGSAVMNISGFAARALQEGRVVSLTVDWVPEKNQEVLRQEFTRYRQERPVMQVNTLLARWVARRVANFICAQVGVRAEKRLAGLSKAETAMLIAGLKGTRFAITGTEPLARATVSGGGVCLEEVDMNTMAAKRFPGLFFAGEVLDLWAETGGYNLHFAWASGLTVARVVAGVLKPDQGKGKE